MPKKKVKAKKKKPAKKAKKAPAKKKSAAKKAGRAKKSVKSRLAVSSKPVGKFIGGYRPSPNEKKIGEVEDFFSQISVIALTLKIPLSIGDTIHVRGHTTDYTQRVDSMQINHAPVENAKKGDSVGIKVTQKSRKGDDIYRIG